MQITYSANEGEIYLCKCILIIFFEKQYIIRTGLFSHYNDKGYNVQTREVWAHGDYSSLPRLLTLKLIEKKKQAIKRDSFFLK